MVKELLPGMGEVTYLVGLSLAPNAASKLFAMLIQEVDQEALGNQTRRPTVL